MRQGNVDVGRFILTDSKRSDRKRGYKNDLDKTFIESLIGMGCSYCGDDKIRITLDRIDNSKGHTKDNVVPACIRCNYVRRHMPYAAWLILAPAMRRARKLGQFGDWIGRAR
jgi:hypothetical protein